MNNNELNNKIRHTMSYTLQISLKQIRLILEIGVQEFADLIGLTRQTINNLETQKTQMSYSQFVAIAAIIENFTKNKIELLDIISSILKSNNLIAPELNYVFEFNESKTLLYRWFSTYEVFEKNISENSSNNSKNIALFNNLAKNYKIFIDHTIFCSTNLFDTLSSFLVLLKKENNKIIVPLVSINELKNKLLKSDSSDEKKYKLALKQIYEMHNQGLLEVRGESSDINEEDTFLNVFTKFKESYKLFFLSNNKMLVDSVMKLNTNTKEKKDNDILLYGIAEDNRFFEWTKDKITTQNDIFNNNLNSWESI